MILLFNIRIS